MSYLSCAGAAAEAAVEAEHHAKLLENPPTIFEGSAVIGTLRDDIVQRCKTHLADFLAQKGIPESHGLEHACLVAKHVRGMLGMMPGIPAIDHIALELAALLHDVDDRKYWPETAKTLANARCILDAACADWPVTESKKAHLRDTCMTAIHLTSTHANGFDVPDAYADAVRARKYLLVVRLADNRESVGTRGVYRCFAYSVENCRPIYTLNTLRPLVRGMVWAIATKDRMQAYRAGIGKSESMIDHYFDKLLQVAHSIETTALDLGIQGLPGTEEDLRLMEDIVMAERPAALQKLVQKCVRLYHPQCTTDCGICSAMVCPRFSPDHHGVCSWCEAPHPT